MPPQVKPETKSATSPEYSATLRKIMLLDRIVKMRNDRYQQELADFVDNQTQSQANLSSSEMKGLEAGFTRQYYRHEYTALAEYQALLEERMDMLQQKQESGLNPIEQDKLSKLDFYASMTPESYAASKLFDENVLKQFKKEFPQAQKEIVAEIKEIGKSNYPELSGQQAARPATVELFNKKYPHLRAELQEMMKSNDKSISADGQSGLALLRAAGALANPSAYLMSKAVGAILKSDTFRPLVQQVGVSVSRVAEKTGLTGWAKKLMSNMSDVSAKRVAVGVAACCAVSCVAIGVMDPEGATQLYADLSENIMGFSNEQPAYARSDLMTNSADTGVLDHALESDVADSPETPSLDELPGVEDVSESPTVQEAPQTVTQGVEDPLPPPDELQGIVNEANASDINNALLSAETTTGNVVPDSVAETATTQAPPTIRDVQVVAGDGGVSSIEINSPVTDDGTLPAEKIKIEDGDTLSELVEDRFRAAGKPYNYEMIDDYVDQVAALNGLEDKHLIKEGASLEFPAIEGRPPLVETGQVSVGMECITPVFPEQYTDRVSHALSNTGMNDPLGSAMSEACAYVREGDLSNVQVAQSPVSNAQEVAQVAHELQDSPERQENNMYEDLDVASEIQMQRMTR